MSVVTLLNGAASLLILAVPSLEQQQQVDQATNTN